MDDIFKNKGKEGMSERIAKVNPYLTIIVSVVAIVVQGIAIPTWRSLAEKVDKHEVALAKAEQWMAVGPRFTKTDAELLHVQTLEKARMAAAEMDADLKRQMTALQDSQVRLERDMREFRDTVVREMANVAAKVSSVTDQLSSTQTAFSTVRSKLEDLLIRLDQMEENTTKGKQ